MGLKSHLECWHQVVVDERTSLIVVEFFIFSS